MHLIWFMRMGCIFHHIKQHLAVLVRSTNSSCVNNQDKMCECLCACVTANVVFYFYCPFVVVTFYFSLYI